MPPISPTKPSMPAYVMPKPGAIVVWRNAPGVPPVYAIVTAVGKQGLAVMLFPSESRAGVPKEAVRHVGDPWNDQHGINPDSGVWDYTEEQKLLTKLATQVGELLTGGQAAKKS